CGVAGAMLVFLWYGSAEPTVFSIDLSFTILFMVIIGGLGSLLGAFLGAALIHVLPIVLRGVPPALGLNIASSTVEHLNLMIVGALIILFLVAEPFGLARLWQTGKQKLRVWPFPYYTPRRQPGGRHVAEMDVDRRMRGDVDRTGFAGFRRRPDLRAAVLLSHRPVRRLGHPDRRRHA